MRIDMHFLCRLCFCGAIFVFLPFSLFAAEAAPQFSTGEVLYDFGEILQGDVVEYAFDFSNAGDADLIIENVRSSCGCTAALASSRRLSPGKRGSLQMIFDSRDFRGRVLKTARVTTNDPHRPEITFRLQGKVRSLLHLHPAQVSLGILRPGQEHLLRITLVNQGEDDLVLTQVRSEVKGVSPELGSARLAPGEEGELLVRTRAEEEGRLSGAIVLELNGGAFPAIRIPVGGLISAGAGDR